MIALATAAVVVVAMSFWEASPAYAATTYWVSTTGNDGNAGTSASPFRTVQKAATVAVAGDTVMIRNGTYAEPTITVVNSGTSTNPITFQAEFYRGVRLTDGDNDGALFYTDQDGTGRWSSFYITLRGIIFGPVTRQDAVVFDEEGNPTRVPLANCSGPFDGANPSRGSISAARGWRLEDSVLDRTYPFVADGAGGDVDDVTVLRTVFTDSYNNGADIIGNAFVDPVDYAQNARFTHVIFRRSNQHNCSPGGYAGANKHLYTNGMLFDGVVSYDNNGSGSWMDYDSHNFTVRNSTFFGNHAGFGAEPPDGEGNQAVNDQFFAGSGFISEANGGPATIQNNVFYSNLFDGYANLDSGKDGPTVISNNTFVDNGTDIEFRGLRDTYQRELGPSTVTGNKFKRPRDYFWHTNLEQFIPCDAPPGCGNVINNNTYEPPPGGPSSGQWAYWISDSGDRTDAASLAELRANMGVEAGGTQAAIPFRGTLINTFAYPDAAHVFNPAAAQLRQVPSASAEANTIDAALAGHTVGQTVTIPVFGRTPVTPNGDGTFTAQVHDLQGRYVTLRIPSSAASTALTNAVTPHAIIDVTNISVTLTVKAEYSIQATYTG